MSLAKIFLVVLILVVNLLVPTISRADDQPQVTLSSVGNDSWLLTWSGVTGRTYFIQHSDDLVKWKYFPTIQSGTGSNLTWSFETSASRIFVRLRYTDRETWDPYYDDFDGDGLSNWDEVAYYNTDPFNPDSDGDGLSDGDEVWYYGSDPNLTDTDGDGISDFDEVTIYGTNPTLTDSDGDGISDYDEIHVTNTDPTNPDTDGDGTNDGDEIAQGTDPRDPESFLFQWHRVTRALQYDFDEYPPPTGNRGWLTRSAHWNSALDSTQQLSARIPFPDLRSRLEQLAFPEDPPSSGGGNAIHTGWGNSNLLPNPPCYHARMHHHRYWFRRADSPATAFSIRAIRVLERTIDWVGQPLTISETTITIPANQTTAPPTDLVEGFTRDWADNTSHSERYTHRLAPLELIQDNMPNKGVPENSTDLGGQRGMRLIGIGGTAYITGQPAIPQLRVRFRDLPAEISVDWRLEIRTERAALRGTLDDRNIPESGWVTLPGDQDWDIGSAMNSEFVGGSCTLHYRINGGDPGSISFFIRGKNPLDADALAHINATVGVDFRAYAWAMAQHESRQGSRVFNQFNTQAGIEGTLNFGQPNGWGLCQIDRPMGNPGVTTAEVWNWHQNVAAMQEKLVEKQSTYRRFIGYFRDSYGHQANWSEPPAQHTIGQTTLPAEAWGVMVLYNGADGGVPVSSPPSRPQGFRSPWKFNPQTGAWSFHDNSQNYASGPTRVRPELEQTTSIQE